MKKHTILFAIPFFLLACAPDSGLQQELATARQELARTDAELQAANRRNVPGSLVHIVYFDLKEGWTAADRDAFITGLEDMRRIEQVRDLQVGTFTDVGDPRGLSDFEVVMRTTFDDREAYDQYQQHPIHLAVKEKTRTYLREMPRVTYDYLIQPTPASER